MSDAIHRIEVDTIEQGAEAKRLERKLKGLGFAITIAVSKVYTIQHAFSADQLKRIAGALHNPVVERVRIDAPAEKTFDWALELGFLPGVTDNVANTATEIIEDLFGTTLGRNSVFTSKVLFLSAPRLVEADVKAIAGELINTLIERYHAKPKARYDQDCGMDRVVPKVSLTGGEGVIKIALERYSDQQLAELGKKGITDPRTGQSRGPLALDIDYMFAIREYFSKEGRAATDIEVESIAQTWSEHCKHTIFAGRIDEVQDGLYKHYIKAATNKVRKLLGEDDFCVSVFKDNSGGIVFDDDYLVTDKAETHNSPSALDPFGGSITGIVGVNRDTIGFGKGALPIANKYGFCLGRPEDKSLLYRGQGRKNPTLLPRRIMDGVVHGVNVGGNCSGIPTPTGFVYFDDCYKGKPLIFVGTLGLLPRKLPDGTPSHEKQALPGDNIVMIGGRVGKDGIHGATFSSEALDEGSPATAVQIGDPITQKKLSDAIVKEARDLGLYDSITDNGAGGLSCSVAEMARECGGFVVNLEQVPLKYPGLQPWEIWISESQERMTLAVPDAKLEEFMGLMAARGVEATVIGTFNDTDRAIVKFKGKVILDLDMAFLHDGLPQRVLTTSPYPYQTKESSFMVEDHQALFERLLGAHNNCGFEFISKQYDHEVQGTSVLKPLQGKGRVNGSASVIRPLLESDRGVVLSQSLYPRLSEVSCYDMASCCIDTAIRDVVAAGGNIDHLALMDNFCWCSSTDPKRLRQLKDAARACYDYAVAFKTPFISGKDSMFNDFKGFDEKDNPVTVSVLPTLMVSGISVIADVTRTASMDFKLPGEIIYAIGQTKDECGASELYRALGHIAGTAPKVDAVKARPLYVRMRQLHEEGLLSSCAAVGRGGLGVLLAKMALAGMLGARIDVSKMAPLPVERVLYSESQSRFVVTIAAQDKERFEQAMQGFTIKCIGTVASDGKFIITHEGKSIVSMAVKQMQRVYKERFEGY